jgi:hypothetical protein
MVNWDQIATVAGSTVVVVYPALGIAWRWVRHTEDRFDELQSGVNELRTGDSIDVAELRSFKQDVGRRLGRLEDKTFS